MTRPEVSGTVPDVTDPADNPADDPLLSYKEVAARLRIGNRSAQRLMASGAFPVIRIAPQTLRVDPADLDAYIKAQKVQAEATGGAA